MDEQAQIEASIANKQIIEFDYNGFHRIAEPHHDGILNDKLSLHAYQIAGESKSGNLGWKNFEIALIKNLVVQSSLRFTPRVDHNPGNSHYSEIKKSIS